MNAQYKGRPFKVANFNRWLVIVSGPRLIDDVRKAADNELSFIDAANEVRPSDYATLPGHPDMLCFIESRDPIHCGP